MKENVRFKPLVVKNFLTVVSVIMIPRITRLIDSRLRRCCALNAKPNNPKQTLAPNAVSNLPTIFVGAVIYGVKIQSITAKSVGSVIKSLPKTENTALIVICVLKRVMAT